MDSTPVLVRRCGFLIWGETGIKRILDLIPKSTLRKAIKTNHVFKEDEQVFPKESTPSLAVSTTKAELHPINFQCTPLRKLHKDLE